MKAPAALRSPSLLCLAAVFGLATAQANTPPITLSVTPASAGGAEQRFTFEYADSDGPGDIAQAQVVINTGLDGAYGCYFIYVRDTNSVVLANENGYGPYGSVAVGSAAVLGHARCLIREPAIRTVGNSLLLDITVRFLWPFNGDRRIYLLAIDTAGATGGWDQRGAYLVNVANSPPSTTSTTPNSGSGMSQRFEFRYADPNGYSDVASAQVVINTQLNGAYACYILYDRPTRTVVLARDDGWGAAGSLSLVGNPGLPVSNLQCTISAPQFTVLGVNDFAFSVQVQFTPAFAATPAKTIWMLALDTQPLQGGWDQRGTWTVAAQPGGLQVNPAAPTEPVGEGGKGPPAAGTQGCGNPNCGWMSSAITYIGPGQAFGLSTTFTTGPDRSYFTNLALARMFADGQDLGSACPADATSLGDVWATSRVPCNVQTNFYLHAPKLYTLTGYHRSFVLGTPGTGVITTFDSLSFVAAGTSRDFNGLPMGPFSNFQNASAPTILPSNDGVTVQYTARTVTTVSVRITAPYSARKGRHQLSFPTTDIYGFPAGNPYFAIVVYDATPVIATVTPNPIPAGTATTLTVTGTGFGDHPTVYVAGTAYNPGAPSRNPQGHDVVGFSVTLPLSQAGSPVPVYVVSNGAGGQAFFGAPQGASQGSPTSNTVQVQVAAPPTIDGNPGIWWLGAASVNDNCDPGSPLPSCYYNSTLLTVTPGAGGTPPTPSSPAVWTLTDGVTGQAPTFATYACADGAACNQITVRATGQPPYCISLDGNLQVRVTLGGISSAAFKVWVNWPHSTVVIRTDDFGLPGPPPGYISWNTLQLLSGCGLVMYNMAWHEEFPTDAYGNPAAWNVCGQSQGWAVPIPKLPTQESSGWASGITDAVGVLHIQAGIDDFDAVGYSCDAFTVPPCVPPSNIPGPFRGQPLDVTANAWSYQLIYVGSKDIATLGKYWPAAPNKQVRYTDHGRDELGTWNCPAP